MPMVVNRRHEFVFSLIWCLGGFLGLEFGPLWLFWLNGFIILLSILQDHVPFEAEMAIPRNVDIGRVSISPEFAAFTERIKRDFQVSIVPIVNRSKKINGSGNGNNNGSGNSNGSDGSSTGSSLPLTPECSFKFMCQRSNSDFLIPAREMLEQFLVSQNVPVYPTFKSHHKRADSFAESLPHFDSKLLSAAHGTFVLVV